MRAGNDVKELRVLFRLVGVLWIAILVSSFVLPVLYFHGNAWFGPRWEPAVIMYVLEPVNLIDSLGKTSHTTLAEYLRLNFALFSACLAFVLFLIFQANFLAASLANRGRFLLRFSPCLLIVWVAPLMYAADAELLGENNRVEWGYYVICFLVTLLVGCYFLTAFLGPTEGESGLKVASNLEKLAR